MQAHPIVLGNAVLSMATQPVGGLRNLTTANKPLLVRLVKLCQKKNLSSTAGTWADFVKDSAAGLKDPNLVPEGLLAEFISKVQGEAEQAALNCVVEWDKDVQKDSGAFDELDRAKALSGAWAAVKQTRRHSQFQRQFGFPSWDEGWRRVPRKAPSMEGEAPVLVGVDCEMCETATNKKELLKVCCVSQEGKVLLEELVKPSSEVTDYRSHITGIKEQDMQGVTFTLEDAQEALLQLVRDEGVILVGHSISHDLQALRFDYQPVIDTALIFKFRELGLKMPSLQQLAQAVLGRSVRQEGDPHNCQVDAQAAMELVQHIARNGLPRPLPQPDARISREQLQRLLVHRIPKGTSHDDLKAVFPDSLPQVQEVHSIPGSDKKVLLEFKNPQHANMAFKGLAVEAHRDSSGLFQKLVVLTQGAARGKLVCVRKMAGHNGHSLGQDEGSSERRSKRRREQAKAGRSEDEPEL